MVHFTDGLYFSYDTFKYQSSFTSTKFLYKVRAVAFSHDAPFPRPIPQINFQSTSPLSRHFSKEMKRNWCGNYTSWSIKQILNWKQTLRITRCTQNISFSVVHNHKLSWYVLSILTTCPSHHILLPFTILIPSDYHINNTVPCCVIPSTSRLIHTSFPGHFVFRCW